MWYQQKCIDRILEELLENAGIKKSVYCDFFDGSDYLSAVLENKICIGDMVLMMSINGAQLYCMKSSDCWIYIWIILNLAPDKQYQKCYILPGGFIPGPNKPKNLDSFTFPGLHHLAVIQKFGLKIWDAFDHTIFESHPFLALMTANGPAMAAINGCVGHHGKYGC